MAGYSMMRMLLLLFIGVKGEEGLLFPERDYDITFPCGEDLVCFHLWHFSTSKTSDYIAIVTNGEIQTAKPEDEDSKCTLQIKDLMQDDVGHHSCQKNLDVFSPHITTPQINLMSGKTVSLQCILLVYVEHGHCNTQLQQVSLMWVDEASHEIQQDSQYQIKQESACAITLTVTFQSPEKKKFRCQAIVDEQVVSSVELQIRVPALKGRGRGLIIELEPEDRGFSEGKQDVVGPAVGVAGGVVLTALIAAFVLNRRRTNDQLADESYTTSANNVMNPDEVIYADIILPAGSDQVWVQEDGFTEYACVRSQ